jgi:preprotein translocase subunit SecA
MLREKQIPHEVLNAKNHDREAEIIAKAGLKGSVTIATNMAGRGTDIKLGPGVVELGGLAVLGSERHESRRIDNQLRGRSGRQGDPGYSQFFISAEDELLLRFGGERFRTALGMISKANGVGEPLQSRMFTNFVTGAQKRIEGSNFDTRKNVLKYDDVIRVQRELIYQERTDCLKLSSIEDRVNHMIDVAIDDLLDDYLVKVGRNLYNIDDEGICKKLNGNIFNVGTLHVEDLKAMDEVQIKEYVRNLVQVQINQKKINTSPEIFNEFLKVVFLRVIDTNWMAHIDTMDGLRQGIGLQQWGGNNPLLKYQQEGLRLFNEMRSTMAIDVTRYVTRAVINVNVERAAVVKNAQTNEGKSEGSGNKKHHSNNQRYSQDPRFKKH